MKHLNRITLVALWLAGCGLAPAAHAQRIALVIGNATYEAKPLRNPVNDAQDVSAELKRAGFTVKTHTNLDRRGLNAAVRQFTNQAQSAQLALVYYSGHGMQSSGENYLIPTDARINDEKDIRSEGMALKDLLGDLDDAKVQKTVVILDACRDNPYQTRTRSGKRGLARVETAGNATVVAFATADGQTADDGNGRNGVYTTALLDQLRQAPQDIRDLLDETANAVARQTKSQKPKVYGDTGAFKGVYLSGSGVQVASVRAEPVLSPAPAPSNTNAAGAADLENVLWGEVSKTNSKDDLEAYLSEYPRGKYAALARMRVKKLQEASTLAMGQPGSGARSETEQIVRPTQAAAFAPAPVATTNQQPVSQANEFAPVYALRTEYENKMKACFVKAQSAFFRIAARVDCFFDTCVEAGGAKKYDPPMDTGSCRLPAKYDLPGKPAILLAPGPAAMNGDALVSVGFESSLARAAAIQRAIAPPQQ